MASERRVLVARLLGVAIALLVASFFIGVRLMLPPPIPEAQVQSLVREGLAQARVRAQLRVEIGGEPVTGVVVVGFPESPTLVEDIGATLYVESPGARVIEIADLAGAGGAPLEGAARAAGESALRGVAESAGLTEVVERLFVEQLAASVVGADYRVDVAFD